MKQTKARREHGEYIVTGMGAGSLFPQAQCCRKIVPTSLLWSASLESCQQRKQYPFVLACELYRFLRIRFSLGIPFLCLESFSSCPVRSAIHSTWLFLLLLCPSHFSCWGSQWPTDLSIQRHKHEFILSLKSPFVPQIWPLLTFSAVAPTAALEECLNFPFYFYYFLLYFKTSLIWTAIFTPPPFSSLFEFSLGKALTHYTWTCEL